MKVDLIEYLSDAVARVEGGGVNSPSGSWLSGMFGKAANLFEKEVRAYVTGLLKACDLAYPADLRETVKVSPPYEKLTLGQLAAIIREVGRQNPQRAAQHVPGSWKLGSFVEAVQKVNNTWVDTKHGNEVPEQTLVSRMKTMLNLAKLLRPQK